MFGSMLFALLAAVAPAQEVVEELDNKAIIFEECEAVYEECPEELVLEEVTDEEESLDIVYNDEE
jgi:hypothetical protein